ncbi:hypothetical protein D4716_22010 [Shigella boydii]|uniref:hypothetical protein n=2 Tax=Escherichia coli TaxID=562 RepID=UPI00093D3703|nr:hypothetical protein [Escherichia coli]EFP9645186.1 hypothetical protein [Shigella boydii]EHZ2174523.1 hypothetical protein [Shigella sonnei]EFK2957665.1 hypothetical protein [Escherichia coli]EFK2982241.1 hypothetical protein [Escherichia coli]EFK3041242.1 hypothetical protein [Escherichia coli]
MPDLEIMPLQSPDFYKKNKRVIYDGYKCNCTKDWKKEDRFVVYKADCTGINKIINTEISDNNIDTVIKLAEKYTSDKIIISGGHTVVNLNDRFSVSNEVEKSAKFCIDYIIKSTHELNIKPDFLMEINDFYMEKSNGEEIDGGNIYRKLATSPYIIPEVINNYIIEKQNKHNIKINCFYASEKNMADRFKRHIKSKEKEKPFFKENNSVFMNVDGSSFEVIKNNKPTCAAGNAATFRSIRYKISSNKTFDNYTSHIGVFPLCSMANVINGYKAAASFYSGLNPPCLLIFFGTSCFK